MCGERKEGQQPTVEPSTTATTTHSFCFGPRLVCITMVSMSFFPSLVLFSLFSTSGTMAFQKAGLLTRLSRHALTNNHIPKSRSWTLFQAVKEEVDPGVVEGTDLQIVKYPHPALRRENSEITKEELKDGSITKLAKEMFLLMYAAEGVGLAAPQVGVNKRLMVYNQSGDKKKWLDEMYVNFSKLRCDRVGFFSFSCLLDFLRCLFSWLTGCELQCYDQP